MTTSSRSPGLSTSAVGLARIELPTSALSVLRSNRLSYSPGRPVPRTFEATPPSPGSPPRRACRFTRSRASSPPTVRGPRRPDRRWRGGCRRSRTTVLGGQRRPVGHDRRWDTGSHRWPAPRCWGPATARSTCTFTKTRPRGARLRIGHHACRNPDPMMGPFVPNPTMTSPAELAARLERTAGSLRRRTIVD